MDGIVKAVLVSQPQINLDILRRVVNETTDFHRPLDRRRTDSAAVGLTNYLALLGNGVDHHVHLGFVVVAPIHVCNQVAMYCGDMPCVRCETRNADYDLIYLTGSLSQWNTAMASAADAVVTSVRAVFDQIFHQIVGLGFDQCQKPKPALLN